MPPATVIRFADTETVPMAHNSHYRPIVGDAEGGTPIRTGIQVCEPGYATAMHSHPYLEILHILDGAAEAWLDGEEDRKTRLEKGDTIMLPPNVLHAFAAVGEAPLRLLGTHVSPKRIVNYRDGGATNPGGYPVLAMARETAR